MLLNFPINIHSLREFEGERQKVDLLLQTHKMEAKETNNKRTLNAKDFLFQTLYTFQLGQILGFILRGPLCCDDGVLFSHSRFWQWINRDLNPCYIVIK
jgi:hypothetical protein